jgi:hypothetical protein
MAPVVMKRLAPGCHLEEGPTGHRLSWPGSEASFYYAFDAMTFSWVIDADPAAIVASCHHFNGELLFDLGAQPLAELPIPVRPHGNAQFVVPPIEVPQPDDRADRADRATIDAVLADLGWQRRLPSVGEVLVVGDRWMGRAIAYRQTQFVYGHTHGHRWGRALCAFSTAAAVRRSGHISTRLSGSAERA